MIYDVSLWHLGFWKFLKNFFCLLLWEPLGISGILTTMLIKAKKGVDDAILHVFNNIFEHLDKPRASIPLMFYDFSSAFNINQPHLLCEKLMKMNVYLSLILWVLDYLTSRPQFVRLSPKLASNTIKTNHWGTTRISLITFSFIFYICKLISI